jgi:hypothetical protein
MVLPLGIHEALCTESRQFYLDTRNPEQGALDWKEALWEARSLITSALRDSKCLTDVSGALQKSGGHALVFRHLLAPPISQDQFKLICAPWSKSSEVGGRPVAKLRADAIEVTILQWRSLRLSPWLTEDREPTLRELYATIGSIAPLIASQRVATARRHRLSTAQEQAVVALLRDRNWQELQSPLITQAGEVPAKHFMHKTRFVSGPNEHQEVDIACGLGGTVVLAMECKVTNDETNSVKRINDVLKKASAWRSHWGTFVRPAALLQGVIKFADVKRLLDSDVEVFWAHRLDLFGIWLDSHMEAGG